MIWRLLLTVVAVLAVPASQAFETHLIAGLAITVDRIPEPVAVDGVAVIIHRATGVDVPELARRFEALWRSQGSAINALQQGSWTLRTRMLGAKSEVVQWRIDRNEPELIWSSLDAAGSVGSTPDAGLRLPASCSWGRSISGRSGASQYLQRTARCTCSAQELSLQLQRSLQLQGWQVRTASDNSLLLDRLGAEGLLSLTAGPGDRATWLTWLRVEHSR
jgi:hypothetical protein